MVKKASPPKQWDWSMNAVLAECHHCAPSGFHLVSLDYNLDISLSITSHHIRLDYFSSSHSSLFILISACLLSPLVLDWDEMWTEVTWNIGIMIKSRLPQIEDLKSQLHDVACACFSRLRARIQERGKNIKLVIGIRFIFSFLNLYFLVPKKQHSVKAFWHLCTIVKEDEVTTSKFFSLWVSKLYNL